MCCKLFVEQLVVIKCSQNRLNSSVKTKLGLLYDYGGVKHFVVFLTLSVFIHPDCRLIGCNVST